MPATTTYLLPYPVSTDTPQIPLHFKSLADRLEIVLASIEGGADNNTTYTISADGNGGNTGASVTLNLNGSDNSTDTISLIAGTNISLIRDNEDITINAVATTYTAGTGLALNTNQFSVDGNLLAIDGLASAADKLPYFTASETADLTTLTPFGRSLIDDADSATARTTLGLGTMATANTGDYAAIGGAEFTGTVIAPAATTSLSSLRIPHGTAPQSPINGDVWTTNVGMYIRINGSTVGPLGTGGGTLDSLTDVSIISSPTEGQVLKYTQVSPGVFKWRNGTDSTSSGAGSGDVVGPNSSIDNTIPRFDSTSGKIIQNSSVTIDDSNNIVTTGNIAINNGTSTAITTTGTTAAIFNSNATTVNIGGAATTLTLGATSGTASINNVTFTLPNATTFNINGANPTLASSANGTLTLFNTNITTVNAFGSSTALTIGATTATSTHNFATGATASGATKTINIGTSGVSGSTTTINIGSTTGTTGTTIIGLSAANATLTTPVISGSGAVTADGQIGWNSTYNHFNVGDGTNTMIVPTFRVNETLRSNGTLTSADVNTLVQIDSTSSITVSLPTDSASIPVGSQIHLIRTNTGAVSVQTSNVAATPGHNLRARYSSATLIKLRADNTWLLVGDLSA